MIPDTLLAITDPLDPKSEPMAIDAEAWRLAQETRLALTRIENHQIIENILARRFQEALTTGENRVRSEVVKALQVFGPDRRYNYRMRSGAERRAGASGVGA